MTGGGGAAARWRAAAHVFVADVDDPLLEEGDAHHLRRVLRLRDGEVVTATDGAGRWRPCRIAARGGGVALEPDGPVVAEAAPSPPVAVAMALSKGGRPEWAVQKLTELGVDRILLLHAARSVVRWDGDRAGNGLARLRRVAREAAMQCRRATLPDVGPVVDVPGALARAAATGAAPCVAVPGGSPPTLERSFVLVGPEGGWEADEVPDAVPTLGLGPGVLRTETAAVAAATLLTALRAGVVTAARRGR